MLKFVKKFWMFVLVALVTMTLVSCVKDDDKVTVTIGGLKETYEFNTGDEFNKDILLEGVTVIGSDKKDYSEYLVVSGLERFKVDAEGKLKESGSGNVKLEVIVDGKVVTSTIISVVVKYVAPVTDDIIINGDFATGSVDPFTKGEFNGGTGTMEVVNEELKLTVTALGWVNGGEAAPRVESNVFTLEDGKFYEVTFDVRANVPTSVQVQVGELLSDAPYFNETFTKVFAVSTEMTTITYRFAISATAGYDITKLQLLFGYGTHAGFDSAATDVFMDNIAITEVSSLGEDTEAPVITMNDVVAYIGDEVVINPVVKDNQDANPTVITDAATVIPQQDGKYTTAGDYIVTITATDAAGNEATKTIKVTVKKAIVANVNLVSNGDFASTTFDDDWEFYGQADYGCTIGQKVENGQLVLTLTGTPDQNYHHQVKFHRLPLVEGKKYHITVVLTSSIDRKVQVLVQNDGTWSLHYDETKDVIANTDVTFDQEFIAIAPSHDAFLGIMLGKIGENVYSTEHTVTVKSVSITLVDGGTTPIDPVDPTYADENNLFGTYTEALWEGEAVSKTNPNKFYVWNVQDATWGCGPANTITYELVGGKLHLTSVQTADHFWFATQVFYTTLPFKTAGEYELTFKFESNVAGEITVCGQAVTLVVGTNEVKVPVTVAAGAAVTLSIQLGKNGTVLPGEFDITLSDFAIAKKGTTEPVDPVDPTYADENNLFGNPIDVVAGGEVASKADAGHLYVWNGDNYPDDYKATFTFVDGVLTLNANQVEGDVWWATQVFYTTLPFKNGGNYELHLMIVSNTAGNITIHGRIFALVMGENEIMVPIKVGANQAFTLSIQLGKADGNEVLLGENIELRFSQFLIKVEEVSPVDPVEGGEATILAKGATETRFEGAGAHIWIDTDSIGMTAANFASAKVTAEVAVTGPQGQNVPWMVQDAFFSDQNFDAGYVRAYVTLNGAPVDGYKTKVTLTIICNGKKFTAVVNFDGTKYDDPNQTTPDPIDPVDPVEGGEATILAEGNGATRFEGAGAWIWVDINSIEMTGANFGTAKVTATVDVKDPAGNPVNWTVTNAFFSDLNEGAGYVRAYVILTGAPVDNYDTTITLTITSNGKTFTATVNFNGNTYVPAA